MPHNEASHCSPFTPSTKGTIGLKQRDRSLAGSKEGQSGSYGEPSPGDQMASHRYVRKRKKFVSEHPKQAEQSWGATTGEAECADEKAGKAIAKAEEKDEGAAGGWDSGTAEVADVPADADGTTPTQGSAPTDAPAAPVEKPEPEDNSRSYANYLREQAEKKSKLGGGVPEARIFNARLESVTDNDRSMVITAMAEKPNFHARTPFNSARDRESNQKQWTHPTWEELGGDYLHFTLFKESKDTMECIHRTFCPCREARQNCTSCTVYYLDVLKSMEEHKLKITGNRELRLAC